MWVGACWGVGERLERSCAPFMSVLPGMPPSTNLLLPRTPPFALPRSLLNKLGIAPSTLVVACTGLAVVALIIAGVQVRRMAVWVAAGGPRALAAQRLLQRVACC